MNPKDLGYRVEVFQNEPDSMFKMESASLIINAIKNLKKFETFEFTEVPSWDLRIMKVVLVEHSYRSYYLQYNTNSRRYRLIVYSPNDHQIPKREDLTMINNNNRSKLFTTNMTRRDEVRISKIMYVLNLMKDNDFWNELNDLYQNTTSFVNKYSYKYNSSGGKKRTVNKK
jgi:hypothetical protein